MDRGPVVVEAAAGPYRIFTASTMGQNNERWHCLAQARQCHLFFMPFQLLQKEKGE